MAGEKPGHGPTDLTKGSTDGVGLKDAKPGDPGKEGSRLDEKGRSFAHQNRPTSGSSSGDEKQFTSGVVQRPSGSSSVPPKPGPSSSPKAVSSSSKDGSKDAKKDSDKSRGGGEAVKPTMETHGPPPPTGTPYAYLPYLGSPYQGGPRVPFDPSIYQRLTPAQVMGSAWFQTYPPVPRFLEPGPGPVGPDAQDLSGKSNKALDLLRHHVGMYPVGPPVTLPGPHKIQELQGQGKGPAGGSGKPDGGDTGPSGPPPAPPPTMAIPQPSSPTIGIAEAAGVSAVVSTASRSPPAQHHVHTHHHTHVGLTHVGLTFPVAPQFPGAYTGGEIFFQP
jgi:hypothetical protein